MTPTHASTPCVEHGCFNLATHKGRCSQCNLIRGGNRVAYDQKRGSPRERGYDSAWEKRRRWHLKAEPFCRQCGKPGNQVDHVIPHRGEKWLFDLKGNLQTLCERHHQNKTAAERSIPIGMMYPLDLPEPPHYRPIRVLCGPSVDRPDETTDLLVDGSKAELELRNERLRAHLHLRTRTPFTFVVAAPRTAERAFWSYVMDCDAELVEPPIEWAVDGHPKDWWDEYMLDARAEEAMARRLS